MDLTSIAVNTALACGACSVFNLASRASVPTKAGLNADQQMQWRQKVNSLAHATFIGFVSLFILFSEPGLLSNPVKYYSEYGCYALFISMSYFLLDTIDILLHTRHHKDTLERLLHHSFTIAGIVRIAATGEMVGAGLMILMAEINTTFLRVRTLLSLKGLKDGPTYKWVVRFNFVTWLIFKVGVVSCATLWSSWRAYHEMLVGEGRVSDTLMTVTLMGLVTTLNWINLQRLIRRDLKTVRLSTKARLFWSQVAAVFFSNVKSVIKTFLLSLKVLTFTLKY